jgi:hypothetical protein
VFDAHGVVHWMNDLVTVFVFTENSGPVLGDLQFRLIVGLIVLAMGVVGTAGLLSASLRKQAWFLRVAIAAPFALFWAGTWIALHYGAYAAEKAQYARLQEIYATKQYSIAEGIVHVLHVQPGGGHDRGDIIQINGTELEVDAFLVTFGYSKSITHGGVLTDGAYARVYYTDDGKGNPWSRTILRVDVKLAPSQ